MKFVLGKSLVLLLVLLLSKAKSQKICIKSNFQNENTNSFHRVLEMELTTTLFADRDGDIPNTNTDQTTGYDDISIGNTTTDGADTIGNSTTKTNCIPLSNKRVNTPIIHVNLPRDWIIDPDELLNKWKLKEFKLNSEQNDHQLVLVYDGDFNPSICTDYLATPDTKFSNDFIFGNCWLKKVELFAFSSISSPDMHSTSNKRKWEFFDLEAPANSNLSKQHLLKLYIQPEMLMMINNTSTKFAIPLHLRYQPPSSDCSSHKIVSLDLPYFSNINNEKFEVRVPVGCGTDGFVQLGSVLIGVLGAIFVGYQWI